jgi:hypothetical protein
MSSLVTAGWMKRILVLAVALGCPLACPVDNAGAERIGRWRIDIGPAGNEFYEVPHEASDAERPELTEAVLRWPKLVAPEIPLTVEGRFGEHAANLFMLVAENERGHYWFLVNRDARLAYLSYADKRNLVQETPGRIVPEGRKTQIDVAELPAKMSDTLSKLIPDSAPSKAWFADTLVGPRYIAQVDDMVFYATPGGYIRCGGLEGWGANAEVAADATLGPVSASALGQLLGEYSERFSFAGQVNELGTGPASADGSFRYLVMGDTRSNPDLWPTIWAHIERLDPKPAFVINTGDIVPNGDAREYLDYYIPPLLKTDIPCFVAIGNHDTGQGNRATEFKYLFGEESLNYYFDYGDCRFIFLDNCTDNLPWEEVLELADRWLSETPDGYRKYVACHKPPTTVKKWAYHAMSDAQSKPFTDLMEKHSVDEVFLGHIHAYSTATLNGVRYTVSGGGGAGLHDRYGPMGNVHHYVICDVTPSGVVQQVVRFRDAGEEQ